MDVGAAFSDISIQQQASAEIEAAAAGVDLEGWPLDLSGKGTPPPKVERWPGDMTTAYRESAVPKKGWPKDVIFVSGAAEEASTEAGASQVTGWPADVVVEGASPPPSPLAVEGWPKDMSASFKKSTVPLTGWPEDIPFEPDPDAEAEPAIVQYAEKKDSDDNASEDEAKEANRFFGMA